MSSRRWTALALVLLGLSGVARAEGVGVIPRPLSAQPLAGAPVRIADGAAVSAPRGDAEAQWTARYLAGLALHTRGLRLRPVSTAARAEIVLALDPSVGEGPEGYELTVGHGRVRIAASTDAGLFYGAVTAWQLMTADAGRGPVRLGPVEIKDRPRFAWRGLLLDSARHFQSPAFVERMIDWMALHKLNRLQWHLTDDQGWRLQILAYPRLTSVGAWRPAVDPDTGRTVRYGGFYTQAEVRRIVAYAARRQVTVVPEIEMPGHSLSAILAYPELGAAPPQRGARGDWGVFPDILAPSDRTYDFVTGVLTEVMGLFPSPWINIGGDEAVKDAWRASPAIQQQMKSLGLADMDALQGWFTARVGAFLAAHGRRTIGWDDILKGGAKLPADAAVVSWHADAAAEALREGRDAVIATSPTLYFDNRQAELPSEPPGRGLLVTLSDVYHLDPAPAALAESPNARILGVQANLWTEHMPTEADVTAMAFPRAAALAEVAWTASDRKDWPDFVGRLPAEFRRYRALGLQADQGAFRVRLDRQRLDSAEQVSLSTQLGLGQIRYALGRGALGAASAAYSAPLRITAPTRLRAAAFLDGRQVSPLLDAWIDPRAPLRLSSQQLELCTQKVALNLEAPYTVQRSQRYLVDIMNPCWIYPGADLARGGELRVAVTRLPFNFQLGADAAKVALRPPQTPAGELDVQTGACQGAPAAAVSLAPAARSRGLTVLTARIPPQAGSHDLCLTFTARRPDPMWVVGWAEFKPSTPDGGSAP